MIVKGEILTIDYSGNTCSIRMPIFESAAGGDKTIADNVIFSNTPGLYNGYKVGDIVLVAFENGHIENPCIIGKLYLGAEKENKNARGAINCDSLTATTVSTISLDTKINSDKATSVDVADGLTAIASVKDLVRRVAKLTNAGNVTSQGASTNNAIARFDGTTGKVIKNSEATIDDTGTLTCPAILSKQVGGNTTADFFAYTNNDSDNWAAGLTAYNKDNTYNYYNVDINAIKSVNGTTKVYKNLKIGEDALEYGDLTIEDGQTSGTFTYRKIADYSNLISPEDVVLILAVTANQVIQFNPLAQDCEIAWGDGGHDKIESTSTSAIYHTYTKAGTYTVIIKGMTSINSYAFAYTPCKYVQIGKTITTIGSYAFAWCASLLSLEIPDNVIQVDSLAFAACTVLKDVKIGRGLTTISDQCFAYDPALSIIKFTNATTTITTNAFNSDSALSKVYFEGTIAEFNTITGISTLANITNKYYSCSGLYLHRVNIEGTSAFSPGDGVYINIISSDPTPITTIASLAPLIKNFGTGNRVISANVAYDFGYAVSPYGDGWPVTTMTLNATTGLFSGTFMFIGLDATSGGNVTFQKFSTTIADSWITDTVETI